MLALLGAPRLDGMYLGVDPEGLSFRRAGQTLLLGGESHRTGVEKSHPYRALTASANKLFPQARVCARWSAQDCITLVWKMGDDPVHGVCPSADGSDLSENIPL